MKIPAPLRPIYDAWMAFSQALGKVMSFIILTVLWVIGFGIYAVIRNIAKLFSKTQKPASFWLPADVSADMQRQF